MYCSVVVTLIVASLVKLAATQSIDPSTVDQGTKSKWCDNQQSSCPLLCLQLPNSTGTPLHNDCDPTSLVYSCVCSNGLSPNISEYSQTIPYFECTTAATQCVNNCAPNDNSCQSACRDDHPCGAQNPPPVNTSTLSTMTATSTGSSSSGGASATTTGGSTVYSGFGGASTATASSAADSKTSTRALALSFGQTYGLVLTLAGVCAGFTFLL